MASGCMVQMILLYLVNLIHVRCTSSKTIINFVAHFVASNDMIYHHKG
jgi:hypothetical protein